MQNNIQSVTFDEYKHAYFCNGQRFYGITGAIGEHLHKKFPDSPVVQLACSYGSQVHREVESFYNNQKPVSSDGATTVLEIVRSFMYLNVPASDDMVTKVECEVMVSDFKATASQVDIVMHTLKGVYLFDIKTTAKFDRKYCSLQLSAYKRMYETSYNEKVLGMFVISTRQNKLRDIIEQESSLVSHILEINIKKRVENM